MTNQVRCRSSVQDHHTFRRRHRELPARFHSGGKGLFMRPYWPRRGRLRRTSDFDWSFQGNRGVGFVRRFFARPQRGGGDTVPIPFSRALGSVVVLAITRVTAIPPPVRRLMGSLARPPPTGLSRFPRPPPSAFARLACLQAVQAAESSASDAASESCATGTSCRHAKPQEPNRRRI